MLYAYMQSFNIVEQYIEEKLQSVSVLFEQDCGMNEYMTSDLLRRKIDKFQSALQLSVDETKTHAALKILFFRV